MAILEVYKVTKVFNSNVIALDNISFEVKEGSFVTILGPNGAGKTTLLNIIVGILPPTKGKVFIKDIDVWKELNKVRKFIGFVPQEYGLFNYLTVQENLEYFGKIYGLSSNYLRDRINYVLELLDIKDFRNRIVGKLSGGLKRRVSVAIALLHDPELLIMDEPTTGLDPKIRHEFIQFIRNLVKNGKTIIMSTHITEEAEQSGYVIILHRGKLIAYDKPEVLKEKVLTFKNIVELKLSSNVEYNELIKLIPIELITYVHGNTVRIVLTNPEIELPEMIRKIENVYRIEELKIRKPSLNDVFLKLTGVELGE